MMANDLRREVKALRGLVRGGLVSSPRGRALPIRHVVGSCA